MKEFLPRGDAGAMRVAKCDILILGAGGAGLLAALHARRRDPRADLLLAVKGLLGKSGCTRMVQGGFNAVLHPGDSLEKHFRDTVEGGAYLNDQEMTWTLVEEAPRRLLELETAFGCFFDRNPDGTIHQKPFAGQSFDRTAHRGDLTGIEITNRLTEQTFRHNIPCLEEHRAVELLFDRRGERVAGALLLDMRGAEFLAVNAKAVLLATGGGPTMYKVSACAAELSTDGMALGFEAGAEFVDMEMVQFHPTGLVTGDLQLTGTLLEEGLRGAGARLLNARGERFMARYDPERMERSTRDVVARACYAEIIEGRGTAAGAVYLDISHRGKDFILKNFRGMAARCADVGFDLVGGPVEVAPTAHYMMGGMKIDPQGRTNIPGLYVAGEDAGGIHGANRLGGNGVACSTVFGGRAGDAMAEEAREVDLRPFERLRAEEAEARSLAPLAREGGEDPYALRDEMRSLMGERTGLRRSGGGLEEALGRIREMRERAGCLRASGGRRLNLAWQEALNLRNQLLVCEMVVRSALARGESRGSHFRDDFPEEDHSRPPYNVWLQKEGGDMRLWEKEVALTRLAPPYLRPAPAPAVRSAPAVRPARGGAL